MSLLKVLSTQKLPKSPYPEALGVSVGLLILSEAVNLHIGNAIFRVAASLVLFSAGVSAASAKFDFLSLHSLLARDNRSDELLILGLALSYVGDVLLIPSKSDEYLQTPKHKSPTAHSRLKFAKLFSALAHIAYILAFISCVDVSSKKEFRRADFVMTLIFGWLFVDWLGLLQKERQYDSWFEIPQEMRWHVVGYSSVVFVMVATATATDNGESQRMLGSWLLMLSDLFVISNAFGVKQDKRPRSRGGSRWSEWATTSLGWILYYVSQLLVAGCI